MRVERSEVGTQRTLSSLCSSLTTAQSRSVQYVGVECSLQQNQGVRAWFVISLNSSPSCYEVMTLCVGIVRDLPGCIFIIFQIPPTLPLYIKYQENVYTALVMIR